MSASVLVLAVCVVAAVLGSVCAVDSSPFYLWSSDVAVTKSPSASSYVTTAFDWSDVRSSLEQSCSPDGLTVLAVVSSLSSDHAATLARVFSPDARTAPLRPLVVRFRHASSSLAVPYSTVSSADVSTDLTDNASTSLRVVDVSPAGLKGLTLTPDACTVAIVRLTAPRATSSTEWGALDSVFKTAAMLTGTEHPLVLGVLGLAEDTLAGPSGRRLDGALGDSKTIEYIRISPDILNGLVIALMLFFTTLVGVCCLMGLQTPTKFHTEIMPDGKVFE